MKVQIINNDGETIWERGENQGMTSTAYRTDGTGQKIVEALTDALENVKAQLGVFDKPIQVDVEITIDANGLISAKATKHEARVL